jgi:hypothetical protein
MAKVAETFSFSISERGDSTGETYNWAFTAKRRLSIRDQINKDSTRRLLVGERMQDATSATMMNAEILSLLSVSITESPKDWQETNGGLDFYDDNVLFKIYETIVKEQTAATKATEKSGDEAKVKLGKVARAKKDEAEAKE